MRNDPERSSPSPRSRGCPVAPVRLSRKPPALDRAGIPPERWRSVRGCFPLKELFSKLSVREGPPCCCVVFFHRNAPGGQIRANRPPLPKEKLRAGSWAKPGDRPVHWLNSSRRRRGPYSKSRSALRTLSRLRASAPRGIARRSLKFRYDAADLEPGTRGTMSFAMRRRHDT